MLVLEGWSGPSDTTRFDTTRFVFPQGPRARLRRAPLPGAPDALRLPGSGGMMTMIMMIVIIILVMIIMEIMIVLMIVMIIVVIIIVILLLLIIIVIIIIITINIIMIIIVIVISSCPSQEPGPRSVFRASRLSDTSCLTQVKHVYVYIYIYIYIYI